MKINSSSNGGNIKHAKPHLSELLFFILAMSAPKNADKIIEMPAISTTLGTIILPYQTLHVVFNIYKNNIFGFE